MTARLLPTSLALGLIGAARTDDAMARDVRVTLGRLDVAFIAHSSSPLPHGHDLAVLLALAMQASDGGVLALPVAELLRAARLGTGGRQHLELPARLERLQHAEFHVQAAPSRALVPAEPFRLFDELAVVDGEVRATLSAAFAAQVRASRDARDPLRLPAEVPGKALALGAILELVRCAGSARPDTITVPARGLVTLLGLSGRPDNVQRTLHGLLDDLTACGHLEQVEFEGRWPSSRVTVRLAGPDAELVGLLTARGFRAVDARTLVRKAGPGVRRCVQLADHWFAQAEAKGKPYDRHTRVRMLANLIHHPEKRDFSVLEAAPTPLPAAVDAAPKAKPIAPPPNLMLPPDDAPDARAVPFILKLHPDPKEVAALQTGVAERSAQAIATYVAARQAIAAQDWERASALIHAYATEQARATA